MSTEEEYKKELADNGVDLPEIKEESKDESEEDESEEKETEEESKEPLQAPKERKRSIYDEYKDKKAELKSERELREKAEHERDELNSKLSALEQAKTPEEKQDATDELEAFAQEIKADPIALRKMREVFLKGIKVDQDPSIKKDLEEFKSWKTKNQAVMEKQLFEEEFTKTVPTLKEMFPNATTDELGTMKSKLDEISHTKEYHDKELDYVAFKNRTALEALVSPKKKGIEQKGRKEVGEISTDFDPNADYSKMSMKEREVWEEQYRKLGKVNELVVDGQGRKLLI